MNLLVAELWRFASRRIAKATLIVVLLCMTAGMAIAALQSDFDPASRYESYSEECFRTATVNAEGEPDLSSCTSVVAYAEDDRVDLNDLDGVLSATGVLFMLVTILVAASSLGAEFGAASLSTQLLFEPRRVRVWVTKSAAVAIGSAAITAVLAAVFVGEFTAVAAWRGVTDVEPGFWGDRALDVARLGVAGTLGGLLGFAITGLARRTVAAIVVFIALFIAEPLVYQVTDLFDARLPLYPLIAFVVNPFRELDFRSTDAWGMTSLADAVVVPIVWIIGLLALTGWQFRRSEIR